MGPGKPRAGLPSRRDEPGSCHGAGGRGYLAAGHGDAPTGLGGLLGTAHNPEVWHVDLVVQWLGAVAEQLTVSLLRPP